MVGGRGGVGWRRAREVLSRCGLGGAKGSVVEGRGRWRRGGDAECSRGNEVLVGLFSVMLCNVWVWVSELLARAWSERDVKAWWSWRGEDGAWLLF